MGNKGSTKIKRKPSPELTEADIELLLNKTKFTREEIKSWHAGFINDCPKGSLNKKDFAKMYQKFYHTKKVDKFCEYVFRSFDRDGSGEIDFIEFLTVVSIFTQADIKERLKMSFDMFDLDKNGNIEEKEMILFINAIYDILGEEYKTTTPKEMVKQIMRKLDKNNDQCLSLEEFIDGVINDDHMKKILCPTPGVQ